MIISDGDANKITRSWFDCILVEERLIDSDEPDLSVEIFGEKFSTPLMPAAFSHFKAYGEGRETGMVEYARAAGEMNALNWVGMMEDDEFRTIMDANSRTVRIIKPYKDRKKLFSQLETANSLGAFAAGIDIDHSFGNDGRYDVVLGEEMRPVTVEELTAFVRSSSIPVIIKGVLSVSDAEKCAECGVKGIVVSHHHGRMPYAVPPVKVLPEIVSAVGNSLEIFADCGIERGADAYKAMALGAKAVGIGRAMMEDLEKDGVNGVKTCFGKIEGELRKMMAFTGVKNTSSFDPSVLKF